MGLYRLQQVDRQIDLARARLASIRSVLENDTELKSALNQFNESQSENLRALHNMNFAESEVDTQKIKIDQTESSLYGGSVKNPKELQDLQKDVVSLKKHLSTLEERQLESMVDAENTGLKLEQARTNLELVKSRLGVEHQKLVSEQSDLIKQLESLAQEREAAVTPIAADLLATYEDLRRQKRGIAVVEVEDDACASCGTNINASLQQNAHSQKQLVHCPSCGRILFAR